MARMRVLLVVIAAALCVSKVGEAKVGAKPPPFRLSAVVGGPTSGQWKAEDHLGKRPIVVLFWATWCGPCRQELPYYQELFEKHAKDGLQVVAISMDDTSSITQAGPAARRLGVKFPVLSDLDTRVQGQLNPRRSAPFSLWIAADGRIVWEREGFALAERDVIAKGIEDLMAGREPTLDAVSEAGKTEPAKVDPPPAP